MAQYAPGPAPTSEAWRRPTKAQSVEADAGYPDWVLLNKTARISKDANETTGKCRASSEGRSEDVEVTFCLVHPPDVSCFSVRSPGLQVSDPPPIILCAEGPFVLFRVTLRRSEHFFVYTASGEPSLHRLPEPDRKVVASFRTEQFGLLPCSSLHYQVAFLHTEWAESTDHAIQYYVYVYLSKTTAWRRSKAPPLHLYGSDQAYFQIYGHASYKQITVGVDSVGWVDLMFGILLVRHLSSDHPVVEFIALPKSRVCITDTDNDPYYAPEYFCDVICCGSIIRFVELDFDEPDRRTNGNRWKAITWDRDISWDDWHKGYTVDVDEISVDQSYSSLLPELLNEETQLLELRQLDIHIPTMSMHEDNLLYMMANLKNEDSTAWIFTIDLKHAVLKAMVPVLAEPFYTVTFCCPCGFPKYLSGTTTPCNELVEPDASHRKKKRKKKKKKGPRGLWLRLPHACDQDVMAARGTSMGHSSALSPPAALAPAPDLPPCHLSRRTAIPLRYRWTWMWTGRALHHCMLTVLLLDAGEGALSFPAPCSMWPLRQARTEPRQRISRHGIW